MKIALSTESLPRLKTDLVVAIFDRKTELYEADDSLIGEALADVSKGLRRDKYRREVFRTLDEEAWARALLVFSSAHGKAYDLSENVKMAAARALGYAADYGYSRIAFVLSGKAGVDYVGAAAEGFILGDYRFDKYLKEKHKSRANVKIVCRTADKKRAGDGLERARIISEAVNGARDLVNEPGDKIYPKTLAQAAKRIATAGKLGMTVISGAQLERQKYPGLIAVGKGSIYPPCLIVLRYTPKKKSKKHLALVGKGITFDTGGISIKPSEGMWMMKGDMGGAAAVLGAMQAIAKLKPETQVTGIVAAAENFPGPHSQRPGDIFVARNGKSVMVDNTDAEGRLVLTDALARAGEEKATHIVDAATLTGAVVRALGTSVAGIMGNDTKLVQSVIDSGARHGEPFWELPLVEEYREFLKTPYADINNIGGKLAGAITAGLFLKEFVPDGCAWAHLDIAGPFILERKWKYYPEGATGFGVKTFVDLAERFHGSS